MVSGLPPLGATIPWIMVQLEMNYYYTTYDRKTKHSSNFGIALNLST